MEALTLAMEMEKSGEAFYRELAAKATRNELKSIFTQLADDEDKHYALFKNLNPYQAFEESPAVKIAAAAFKTMVAEQDFAELDPSQLELYQQAMERERKSEEFYLEKAAKAPDALQGYLFKKIAQEEAQHYILLHHIYELVLHPQTWVENGEFVHLEEY